MKNVGHTDKQAQSRPAPDLGFPNGPPVGTPPVPVGPSTAATIGNTLGGGPKSFGKDYGKK